MVPIGLTLVGLGLLAHLVDVADGGREHVLQVTQVGSHHGRTVVQFPGTLLIRPGLHWECQDFGMGILGRLGTLENFDEFCEFHEFYRFLGKEKILKMFYEWEVI